MAICIMVKWYLSRNILRLAIFWDWQFYWWFIEQKKCPKTGGDNFPKTGTSRKCPNPEVTLIPRYVRDKGLDYSGYSPGLCSKLSCPVSSLNMTFSSWIIRSITEYDVQFYNWTYNSILWRLVLFYDVQFYNWTYNSILWHLILFYDIWFYKTENTYHRKTEIFFAGKQSKTDQNHEMVI